MVRWMVALSVLGFIAGAPGAHPARAAIIVENTYDEKAQAADLIVIARVVSLRPGSGAYGRNGGMIAIAEVRQRIKGSSPATLEIVANSLAPELDPHCCEVGKAYLFFLKKGGPSDFDIVNEQFGRIPLEGITTDRQ